jgi:hypothetical protein
LILFYPKFPLPTLKSPFFKIKFAFLSSCFSTQARNVVVKQVDPPQQSCGEGCFCRASPGLQLFFIGSSASPAMLHNFLQAQAGPLEGEGRKAWTKSQRKGLCHAGGGRGVFGRGSRLQGLAF